MLTEFELVEGLELLRVKIVGLLSSVDIGEINNLLNRFFPAGFYYKTFMWPKKFLVQHL